MARSRTRQKPAPRPTPSRREVDREALIQTLAQSRIRPLREDECKLLEEAVETLAFLTAEVERKGTTIERLRRWLFGASTERTDQVCPEITAEAPADGKPEEEGGAPPAKDKQPRRKGDSHGRNGRKDFPSAQRVRVDLVGLKPGDPCPECPNGKVYPLQEPKVLIRIKGMAPIEATVFELERMRSGVWTF